MTSSAPRRTLAITFLAVIAFVAGVYAVLDMMYFLGWLPSTVDFFSQNIWGAFFSGLLALIWFSTAAQLWRLDPRGWLFMVMVSGLSLIFLFLSLIGNSSWESISTGVFLSGLVLILAMVPGTKDAFGVTAVQQQQAAAAAAKQKSSSAPKK